MRATKRVIAHTTCLVLLVLLFGIPVDSVPSDTTYRFEIALRNQNEWVVFSTQVEIGDLVIYSYTHSADRTPVEQVFEIGDDLALHLMAERYAWYGAGLETGWGLDVSFADGLVTVSGYDRSFSELWIRVARTVPQEFMIGDTRVLLSDIAQGGDPLVVYIASQ